MNPEKTNELPLSHGDRLRAGAAGEETKLNAFRDAHKLAPSGVTELNLSDMAKRREQTQHQAAHAAREMERLRGQRDELERERRRLETLEQRQVKYEQEHQGLREGLTHRMELLRKMDLQASRRAELFAVVRRRYEEMLQEVDRLCDQEWPEDRYQKELNRALAIMEDIEREYHRAWSRVEAVTHESGATRTVNPSGTPEPRAPALPWFPRRFREWLWVGTALSLPFILAMLVLVSLARWLWGTGA